MPLRSCMGIILCGVLAFTSCGCASLVKKFRRQPAKVQEPVEEVVVAPEEYPQPQADNHELYRQYFLFWRSWHDELIDALVPGGNHRRQMTSAEEAIVNLSALRALLDAETGSQADAFIGELQKLAASVARDFYMRDIDENRRIARDLRRKIVNAFSYAKARDHIL